MSVPVLTSVGTLMPGDHIRLGMTNAIFEADTIVDAVKPLPKGEYEVSTHKDYGDTREYRTRTFHGEFVVWLVVDGLKRWTD